MASHGLTVDNLQVKVNFFQGGITYASFKNIRNFFLESQKKRKSSAHISDHKRAIELIVKTGVTIDQKYVASQEDDPSRKLENFVRTLVASKAMVLPVSTISSPI